METAEHRRFYTPHDAEYQRPTFVFGAGPRCVAPCECADCNHSFYRTDEQRIDRFCYRKRLSQGEVKKVLDDLIQQAQQGRENLRQQCETHGDRIMSRWKKKSRDKPESWLLRANPDLYMHRWFMARYTNTEPTWEDARNLREAFLLPYLSVELLKMDPAIFLSLLHNRAHYTADTWAPFDSKQLTGAWAMGFFDVDFNESCVVLHGPRYGQLVPWEAEPAHRSDTVGFPRARLVIEAQARLLRFLLRVVDQILEEADLGIPSGSAKFTDMAKSGSKKSGDVAYWSQLTYQPFSAPPMLNMDTIVAATKAQLDAAADYLWLLQTQPSYMRRYVRSIQQDALVKALHKQDASMLITRELIYDIKIVWFWQSVLDEFLHANLLRNRFRDDIAPGRHLPRRYDEALGALELLLVNGMHRQSTSLAAIVPQRPGFRRSWKLEWAPGGLFSIARNSDTPRTELMDADPLEWCLIELVLLPDEHRRFDHEMLFGFLDEHLARYSVKDRARLDEIVFTKLSTYAATSELLSAVRLHHPRNRYRDMADVTRTDDRFAWRFYVKAEEPYFKARGTSAALLKRFCELGPPSGRKDAASLEHFDATNKTLHDFWKALLTAFRGAIAPLNLPEDDAKRAFGFLLAHESVRHAKAVELFSIIIFGIFLCSGSNRPIQPTLRSFGNAWKCR